MRVSAIPFSRMAPTGWPLPTWCWRWRFFGPMRDPVRNKWVLQFGLVACAAVPLLALIAGPLRGIPFGWRLIDCSFGLFGAIPLAIALQYTNLLERRSDGDRG